MLRAGPFSDERVRRLANRRFIPFYFDLSNQGVAGDPAARRFVVARAPELGGQVVPTPDLLFMTPGGKLVGRVSNYASAEQVLAAMQRVLKLNPAYNHLNGEEKKLTGLPRARLLIDLGQEAEARRLLRQLPGEETHYLLGRMARRKRHWKVMAAHFQQVKSPRHHDDVVMESSYQLWTAGRFRQLQGTLGTIPKGSPRYTEARYYLGLAAYHLGHQKQALAIWKKTIEGSPQDPWIYRADWAYSNLKTGDRRSFSTAGPRTSCLNRIGYMGRRNPDLAPRHKQGPTRL